MARPKTYIIKLSDAERAALQKTIRNKKTSQAVPKRCQILLELGEVYGKTTAMNIQACVHWQFTADNARTKLVSLYPKFDTADKT